MYLIPILLLSILLTSCCGSKDVTPSIHIVDSHTQKPLNINMDDRDEYDRGIFSWTYSNLYAELLSATELIDQLFQEMYDSKSEPIVRNVRNYPISRSFSPMPTFYMPSQRKQDESSYMVSLWSLRKESSSISGILYFGPNEMADIYFKVDKTKMEALLDAMEVEAENPKRKSI